jgi:predicted membrane protein
MDISLEFIDKYNYSLIIIFIILFIALSIVNKILDNNNSNIFNTIIRKIVFFLVIIFFCLIWIIPIISHFYKSKSEKLKEQKKEKEFKLQKHREEQLLKISDYYDSLRNEIFIKEKADWIKNGGVVCTRCKTQLLIKYWNRKKICDRCDDEIQENSEYFEYDSPRGGI